jgi:enoyl-CoA hydratase/carnithine racemase
MLRIFRDDRVIRMINSNDYVLLDIAGHIATLTLNRPEKANALSEEMMDALEARVIEADASADVRVIVIAAKGKIFCGGHDLAQMRTHDDDAYFSALFARCSRLMGTIRGAKKPVIAKVQGAAVAAGCQLVATCDLAYAAENAKFGVNGINLGLFCATPSVALSRAVQPRQALELLLTGKLITAPRAVELGLLNASVPAAELDANVDAAAKAIANKLPQAIELGKELFWQQLGLTEDEAYKAASAKMVQNMAFKDTQAMIDAFVKGH